MTAAVPAQMEAMAGTPQTEAGMAAAMAAAMVAAMVAAIAETMTPAIGRMAMMMAVTATTVVMVATTAMVAIAMAAGKQRWFIATVKGWQQWQLW